MMSLSGEFPIPSPVSVAGPSMADTTDLMERKIESQIQDALRATGYFTTVPCNVKVHVSHSGHVTLSGVVSSYYLKQQAQVAALSVASVHSLQNDLVVLKHRHNDNRRNTS